MARRTFFSFDYRQVWKVNQIRNAPNIIGTAAAGFQDASLWEEAKKKGAREIMKLIDKGLENTSVTVVCVTRGTVGRRYIKYEIAKSLERGNGLVAVQIHHLKDQQRNTEAPGEIPPQIEANGFKAYKYTKGDALAGWIEQAATLAGK